MARLNRVKSFRGTSKTADGNLTCSRCGDKIKPGDSYLWWANRTPGSRSGFKRVRCTKDTCRPMPWEYQTTSPHIAALMMADHYANENLDQVEADYEDPEAMLQLVNEAVQGAAEGIREAAEGYGEAADNIEAGFGHETYQSEELRGKSEQLETQADDVENWETDVEPPEREEIEAEDEDRDEEEQKEAWIAAVDEALENAKEEGRDAITEACEQAY